MFAPSVTSNQNFLKNGSIKVKKTKHFLCQSVTAICSAKESTCQCRRHKRCGFNPWVEKIPGGRKWKPAPVFLPGESHGQRSLEGYSPWDCKALDVTSDWAHTHTQYYTQYDAEQQIEKLTWWIPNLTVIILMRVSGDVCDLLGIFWSKQHVTSTH